MSNQNPMVNAAIANAMPQSLASGMQRVSAGRSAPPLDSLARYNVNRAGQVEGVWQPLYDYQLYPAAGTAANLTYFQAPLGAARSYEDTNMELGGQLPTPTEFIITAIGVNFLANFALSSVGAANANSIAQDTYNIMRRGFLRLTIGSKDYVKYTPLMEFPAASRMGGFAAASDATTAAAALATKIAYAQSSGPQYAITPIRLVSSQSFRVTIEFPNGAVPVASADALSRLGVVLYGFLYRLSQ